MVLRGECAVEMIKWVVLFLLTTLTAASVGFGFSARKVVIVWYHVAVIILLAFIVFLFFSFTGGMMGEFLPVNVLEVLVGLGMISLGVLIAVIRPVYPGQRDLLLFVSVLLLDVLILAYRSGYVYDRTFALAIITSLLLTGGLVGGIVFGERKWSNWRVVQMLPYVPSILFILLGLIKML